VVDRRSDASSTGMDVASLSDRTADDELSFVMVVQKCTPRNLPGARPQQPLGPISRLGFALSSREEVNAVAERAKQNALLKFGPTPMQVICALSAIRTGIRWSLHTAKLWRNH